MALQLYDPPSRFNLKILLLAIAAFVVVVLGFLKL